jgi:hypothetical protein
MTEHQNDLSLTPGCIVVITAFDDVPEHSFRVEEVFEDCVTGMALTGPLAGEYGEPDLSLIRQVLSST